MKFEYYLSPEAEHDIDEIITYIAQENPKAAHTFLDSVYETMEKLSDDKGSTPLCLAAENGQVEVIKLLIQHLASHQRNNEGETPLFLAITKGHKEAVKELLSYSTAASDWNTPNKKDVTPLWLAVSNGHIEIVESLLKKGAILKQLSEQDLQKVIDIGTDNEKIKNVLIRYRDNLLSEKMRQQTYFSHTSSSTTNKIN